MVRDETRPSLLLRLRDPHDDDAWAEFDQSYRDLILGYLERCGNGLPEADEIYSNVLVSMNQSLARFEYQPERGRFRDYLRRVVDNAVHTRFRQRRDTPSRLESSAKEALEGVGETDLHRAWEDEWRGFHCRRALKALRRDYDARSLDVFERLLDGQEVAAVARQMDMSEQAVHKVKQRFRERMREIIRRQVEEEDRV